jgi:hypothetical protein
MKYLKLILIAVILPQLFTACGGGGGTSESDNAGVTKIAMCTEGLTEVNTGDTIIEDEENTVIKVVDTDGVKREVCVVSGSAHIQR